MQQTEAACMKVEGNNLHGQITYMYKIVIKHQTGSTPLVLTTRINNIPCKASDELPLAPKAEWV